MTTRGVESTMLRYSDGAVASGVDATAVQDSQQSLEDRWIYGIQISSRTGDYDSPANAATDEYVLNVQVGFNSQANQPGVLVNLMNHVTISLQGVVTPAPIPQQGAKNIAVIFPQPIRWAEGVTISMIAHIRQNNLAGSTCKMEATAIIIYKD